MRLKTAPNGVPQQKTHIGAMASVCAQDIMEHAQQTQAGSCEGKFSFLLDSL